MQQDGGAGAATDVELLEMARVQQQLRLKLTLLWLVLADRYPAHSRTLMMNWTKA